jgi:hypothetical protein
VVFEGAIDEAREHFIDVLEGGDKRADVEVLHADIGASSHAPANHGFTIRDVFCHLSVFLVRFAVGAMMLVVMLGVIPLTGSRKLMVTDFRTHFTVANLAVLNGDDQVELRTTKMLADKLAVIGNNRDLYFLSPSKL